jgi:ADP-ribose pyrophosphatase YjhB (NUDIX family)
MREERVLFMMRSGTGYRDDEYGLPSGKVESGELLVVAAVREAAEEVGVGIDAHDLSMAHCLERETPTGNWLDFFYLCRRWSDEPRNAEPDKCDHLAWLLGDEPAVTDYVRLALAAIRAGTPFATYVGE